MRTLKTYTGADMFALVERLKALSQSGGHPELAGQLHDAVYYGSTSLEILGALRGVILANRKIFEQLLGSEKGELKKAWTFVDRAYGRKPALFPFK